MQENRHCRVRALNYDRPGFEPSLSFPGADGSPFSVVAEDDGRLRSVATGSTGLPEAIGTFAEQYACYAVDWVDGPPPAAPPAPGSARERRSPRLAVPTREELIADGVSEADIPKVIAYQRYYFHQGVWPYGELADPPEGTHLMLERFFGEEGVEQWADPERPDTDPPDSAEPEADGVETHYQRRRSELGAIADGRGGSAPLKEICKALDLPVQNSKRKMVDAILLAEFPLDHQQVEASGV